jgi:hypothetical protein
MLWNPEKKPPLVLIKFTPMPLCINFHFIIFTCDWSLGWQSWHVLLYYCWSVYARWVLQLWNVVQCINFWTITEGSVWKTKNYQ